MSKYVKVFSRVVFTLLAVLVIVMLAHGAVASGRFSHIVVAAAINLGLGIAIARAWNAGRRTVTRTSVEQTPTSAPALVTR